MTKVVGATYANLHACIPLMREVIQAKCTTRQHRQQEARDKATAEKEERKKAKAEFVQKKRKENKRKREYNPISLDTLLAEEPSPVTADVRQQQEPTAGGAGAPTVIAPTVPRAKRSDQKAEREANPEKAWVKSLISFVVRKCAGMGGRVNCPEGMPVDFAVQPAVLSSEESLRGQSPLLEPIFRSIQTELNNHVTAGFTNTATKFLTAVGRSGPERGRIKAALDNETPALQELPADVAPLVQEFRKFKQEPDKLCQLFLSWELGCQLKALRQQLVTLQNLDGTPVYPNLPCIHVMPTGGSSARFVEYTNSDMKKAVKLATGREDCTIHELFNWNAATFDAILRPKQSEGEQPKVFGLPTTISTDARDIHFRFELEVHHQCHDDDGNAVDKVLTRFGAKSKHYSIKKNKSTGIVTTVAELCAAGAIGCADAHALILDVRRILSEPTTEDTTEHKRMADHLKVTIQNSELWTAVDPGYKFIGTRSDGMSLPIGIQYGHKRNDLVPTTVQHILDEFQKLSLHNDDVDARRGNLPRWLQLHAELVRYYGRPAARAERLSRHRNKRSLMDRTVDAMLTAPNHKQYKFVAWGANYVGGKSIQGVHVAGPAKVKSVMEALAKRTLVLLGTQTL
jgi:hypothetical protein